jgi:hypothetical protein
MQQNIFEPAAHFYADALGAMRQADQAGLRVCGKLANHQLDVIKCWLDCLPRQFELVFGDKDIGEMLMVETEMAAEVSRVMLVAYGQSIQLMQSGSSEAMQCFDIAPPDSPADLYCVEGEEAVFDVTEPERTENEERTDSIPKGSKPRKNLVAN